MDHNRAFNEGCDARLEGEKITTNPYCAVTQHAMYFYWMMGYKDIDFNWGFDARNAKPLPPVKE